jgi:hypothetical protein
MPRWISWPQAFRETVAIGEALQRAGEFSLAAETFHDAIAIAPNDDAETEMLARVFRCSDPIVIGAELRARAQARSVRRIVRAAETKRPDAPERGRPQHDNAAEAARHATGKG